MGLASALSTALTGLTAAETTIDVVGNNLANSNTVGFKASRASFATQFLQTQSLGSAPTGDSGGTNPRQTGLGTMVAAITPDFGQGTIEISASQMDMAIQGDGFFMVQGASGDRLYTRNGIFKMNAEDEMTTITGHRLLGFGVDDQFQVQQSTLQPITIPLGSRQVSRSTENVYLEGTLSPQGDLATTAEIIQTGILGNAAYGRPELPTNFETAPAAVPDETAVVLGNLPPAGHGRMGPGVYQYRFVFYDPATGSETLPSDPVSITLAGVEDEVDVGGVLPTDVSGYYSNLRIYRTEADGSDFYLLTEGATPVAPFVDSTRDVDIVDPANLLNTYQLNNTYEYFITFVDAAGEESRPSAMIGPLNIVNGAIQLRNLPVADSGPDPDDHPTTGWTGRRIYRSLGDDTSSYYFVAEINDATTAGLTYTDHADDDVIDDNDTLDFDGPRILSGTALVNVLRQENRSYENVFGEGGVLQFTPRKSDHELQTQELTITSETTVLELITFMEEAMGIQKIPGPDLNNPIPADIFGSNPGGSVNGNGQIVFVGNNGVGNALEINLSGLYLTAGAAEAGGTVNMPFTSSQTAVGESAVADFIAYDSLGISIRVRITAVMEERSSISTTYRWFADSADNDPASGAAIAVGTGLIRFDGQGNFMSATEDTVSIDRANVSSSSPLEFDLDFSEISGLSAGEGGGSTLSVSRQDGSAPGVLTSFIIAEDGTIHGVFSNGITRDLGQIRLARFGNPSGLEQKGQNLFAIGVNSGLPVEGDPGASGIGSIIAGAVELSNTDIGGNLIDLILASTMYRGNTRVITTAQQMLDELLALRR